MRGNVYVIKFCKRNGVVEYDDARIGDVYVHLVAILKRYDEMRVDKRAWSYLIPCKLSSFFILIAMCVVWN